MQPALAVARQACLQRPGEHVVVGDDPLDAGLRRQRGHRVADRHLARPHAPRMHPHQPLEGAHAHLDLALGVLAVGEAPGRKADLGYGGPGGLQVDQQRQDRVVVGREGELDLPSAGQLGVLGYHPPDQAELGFEEHLLVLLREALVFGLELGQAGVAVDPSGVDPGQVGPHLEVADVLLQEGLILGPGGQLQVARAGLYAQETRRLAGPVDQEPALLVAQVPRGPAGEVEEEVLVVAAGVVLDLGQQRGHQVEGLADARVVVQEGGHLVVVLGRPQPHPGQQVGLGEVVLVVGLVHVPDQGEMERSHGEAQRIVSRKRRI